MTTIHPSDKLLTSLLAELEEDHVGLWAIVKLVRRSFPDEPPQEIRSKTLSLIWFLLQMGQVRGGFPSEDGRGFETLSLKPYGIVSRVATEWKNPESYPTIGQGLWFTTVAREPSEPVLGSRSR